MSYHGDNRSLGIAQPIWVERMKISAIASLCIMVCLLSASTGWATAFANAGGNIGDGSDPGDDGFGKLEADAEVESSFELHLDKYHAIATVKATKLSTFAFARFDESGVGAFASAGAAWVDILSVDNPDLIESTQGGFFHFSPIASGQELSGNSFAEFHVALIDPLSGAVYKEVTVDSEINGKHLAARISIPMYYFLSPVSFLMSLEVRARAFDFPGQVSKADFSHTAYLPPIFIGDEEGNPISELADVQLVGDSGRRYSVTTVQQTAGDYNGDGVVDAADYTVWKDSMGQAGLTLSSDGDGNQVVDDYDYSVWTTNFGSVPEFGVGSGRGAVSEVPEPTTFALIFMALGWVALAVRTATALKRSRA